MYSDWLCDNKSVNTAENMQKTRKVMSFEEQLMRLSVEIWKNIPALDIQNDKTWPFVVITGGNYYKYIQSFHLSFLEEGRI